MDIFTHSGPDTRVTQQPLEYLWLHPAFNRTGSISVSQSVHTETLDSVFITDFVKMGVIAAILTGFPRPKIDKDAVPVIPIISPVRSPVSQISAYW